jgi:LAO/AO transport system kinase
MLARAGDELQGIKRGIMEMADAIVINKADGDNLRHATLTQSQYQSAMKLFPPLENDWEVPVKTCSALEKRDIDKVWFMIKEYEKKNVENGFFEKQRESQLVRIFKEWIDDHLKMNFYHRTDIRKKIEESIVKIKTKEITPYQAGTLILELL